MGASLEWWVQWGRNSIPLRSRVTRRRCMLNGRSALHRPMTSNAGELSKVAQGPQRVLRSAHLGVLCEHARNDWPPWACGQPRPRSRGGCAAVARRQRAARGEHWDVRDQRAFCRPLDQTDSAVQVLYV